MEDLVAERDHWIRLFNRIENAVTHHKAAYERASLFVEQADEALWKARDKILADATKEVARR